jgi:hypothetical protein
MPDLNERTRRVLRVLYEADKPLTGNEIGYACGFESGSDRTAHDGRIMGPANRVIAAIRALERRGLATWASRPDGLSGSAHRITELGRREHERLERGGAARGGMTSERC